jgi:hypothetical protein
MRSLAPLLLSVAALAGATAADASAATFDTTIPAVTPAQATKFVDSVGVNIHTGYYDTAYNDFTGFKQKLLDLGVKYVRDGACASCTEQQRRLQSLGAAGIKANFIIGRPNGSESVNQIVDMIDQKLAPMTASVEGANEYDQAGVANWAPQLRSWQQQIYNRVKSDPTLAGVPVIGPSLVASASYTALGDLTPWLDNGNLHPYPGGAVPTQVLGLGFSAEKAVAGSKPITVTESGYHNATSTLDGHLPTSEKAAGSYVPRLFLDHFRAGAPRTYLYELVDQFADSSNTDPEKHFGLLRNDLSAKPAYTSLQSLMKLVTPSAQATSVPTKFRAAGPADMRQMFFQQDANHQVLVLWRDVTVWDRVARKDLAIPTQRATVTFGQPVKADVFGLDDATTPKQSAFLPTSLGVDLGGDAVVIRITLP